MSKGIFIFMILAIVVGCDNQSSRSSGVQPSSSTAVTKEIVEAAETKKPSSNVTSAIQTVAPTVTILPSPSPNVSLKPTEAINSNKTISDGDKVITGTFMYPWSNPMNSGTAEVTKVTSNKYHLNVSRLYMGLGIILKRLTPISSTTKKLSSMLDRSISNSKHFIYRERYHD